MSRVDIFSDPMSSVLNLVRMRGELLCASEMSTPWGLRFDKKNAHFHVVEAGSACLKVKGVREPIGLNGGDLVIIPFGADHTLSDKPDRRCVPVVEAVARSRRSSDGFTHFGGGGVRSRLLCGQFTFEGVLAQQLMSVLPPLIHVQNRGGPQFDRLRLSTQFFSDEARNPGPGSAIVTSRLMDLLFIEALRQWGAVRPGNLSWMNGLNDPPVGRALAAIHGDPARDWSVRKLAQISAMSRSTFSARFTKRVGKPPLRYLCDWRLNMASELLQVGNIGVAEVARRVGYDSEAAFTRAFKKRFGRTPTAFRQA
jgi:AraC-like DNA-binding protein